MAIRPIEMLNGSIITFALGLVLTWIFDSLKEIIKNINGKAKDIFMGIADFISVLIYVLLLIIVLYYNNEGSYRGIYLISIVLGFLIYYMLFSKILRKISKIIIFPIYIVLKFLYKFIRKIFLFLLHAIEKIFHKLYNKIKSCKL